MTAGRQMADRSRRRSAALAVAAAGAAVFALAGCSPSEEASTMTETVAPTTVSSPGGPSAGESVARSAHNAADVAFYQQMIPHHQQALEMAALVEGRTDNTELKALAAEIERAQQPEIDAMTAQLKAWGVDTSSTHGDHGDAHGESPEGGHDMSGMLTAEQMTALENASGAEFDRLWLEGMIAHHEGAVEMAETELADGSDPASKTLAQQIIDTQNAEITQMRAMLGG